MVIQMVDEDGVDHSAEQYARAMRFAHPVFNPIPVRVDTYAQFTEIESRLDDCLNLSWMPRDPGKELAAVDGHVALRHLDLNMPMSTIDQTMNGAINTEKLVSLTVNDRHPNNFTPEPVRFVPEWTSELQMLRLFSGRADIDFMRSLEKLELADFRGNIFDGHALPSNVKYVSAEDADIKNAEALTTLSDLRALRVVVCRGVAHVNRLPLTELQNLESLVLEGFSKTESLDFLEDMPNLRFLGLGGFSKVTDLSPILTLANLEILHIRDPGMRGAKTKFAELAPLLERPNFRWLAGLWARQLGALSGAAEGKLANDWHQILDWPLRHHYFR